MRNTFARLRASTEVELKPVKTRLKLVLSRNNDSIDGDQYLISEEKIVFSFFVDTRSRHIPVRISQIVFVGRRRRLTILRKGIGIARARSWTRRALINGASRAQSRESSRRYHPLSVSLA